MHPNTTRQPLTRCDKMNVAILVNGKQCKYITYLSPMHSFWLALSFFTLKACTHRDDGALAGVEHS